MGVQRAALELGVRRAQEMERCGDDREPLVDVGGIFEVAEPTCGNLDWFRDVFDSPVVERAQEFGSLLTMQGVIQQLERGVSVLGIV